MTMHCDPLNVNCTGLVTVGSPLLEMLKDSLCGGTVVLQRLMIDHGHIEAGRDISELAGVYHGKQPESTAHGFGYLDLGLSPS